MNIWMNEWCIYIVLYCVLLYTQSALRSCAGLSSTSWGSRRLPQDNGGSVLTTHQLQVESRESHRANQVDGDYQGADWQGPVLAIWPGHWGYTPTLYEKCHGILNDHSESGPRFNISSERLCFSCGVDVTQRKSLCWSSRWALLPNIWNVCKKKSYPKFVETKRKIKKTVFDTFEIDPLPALVSLVKSADKTD